MQMRARAFNAQSFLEFLCYCTFSGLMVYLVLSGRYLTYVTPRMAPYLYFAAGVTAVWAIAGLFRMFRPQHRIRSMHCFVLLIPVLLLLLSHAALDTSDLTGGFAGGAQQGAVADAGLDAGGSDSALQSELSMQSALGLSGLDVANKTITVGNDDLGLWVSEIYMDIKKYEGYNIKMTGFVFKDPEMLSENEFVPARLLMSCCAADLTPTGLVCQYDKAADLAAESWVTVEGTIVLGTYSYDGVEYEDPQVRVTSITPAEKLDAYVYAF